MMQILELWERVSSMGSVRELQLQHLQLQCFLYLALISVLPPPAASANLSTLNVSLPGCPDKCGNLIIPYPFGTRPGCYRRGFALTCNESTTPPKVFLGPHGGNVEIIDISITRGEARVHNRIGYRCYTKVDQLKDDKKRNPRLNLTASIYLFSYRRNKFTAMGCYNLAYINGTGTVHYRSGCLSFCESLNSTTADGGSCNGLGCCQTAIPAGLTYYEVQWGYKENLAWEFNPCMSAMIVEEDWYKFHVDDIRGSNIFAKTMPLVLDWAVRDNGACQDGAEESSNPVCLSKHSSCNNTSNGRGYLCRCLDGFEGNPYLPDGCIDIDECKLRDAYPCMGICTNTEGSYMCTCRSGSKGNGVNCIKIPLISPVLARVLTGLGTGIATLMGIYFLIYAFGWWRRNKKEKQLYHKYYKMMDNQLRIFSKKQIETATHNFDESYILGSGGRGKVYKGVFDRNNTVAIKLSKEVQESQREEFVNEIVLLSQINHKNIVRLVGCCLEVKIPILVYEFVPNGTLFELLHEKSKIMPVPLVVRLKIALELAEALDYLHSSISRTIIHGDVKSANILLDNEYCAKISDFGASNIVPTNTTQVVVLLQGTVGYLDPECLCSQIVTKSSDVYSFGVVVLELITRKKAIYSDETDQRQHLASRFVSMTKNRELHELLDMEIVTNDDKVIQVILEISEVAIWCLSAKGENRPTTKQIGKNPWRHSGRTNWFRRVIELPR